MYLDKYKKWLLPVSVLFLLFFSSTTSPLTYNTVGTDSAFFQATGHYMNHGMLMYKDIFDIKGPLLFWIQAFAYAWKIPGRYILFFIQILNAWGCLVLADSIHLQISPKSNLIKRISSSLLFLFIWSFTMDGGNLTEEYCLIFLFLSLWTYLKYCNTQTCTFRYALLYGISFSAILLLKITNSGLIVCIVSLVFFECIYKRKWKDMKRLIIGFILGLFLVITPTLLYFYFI